MPKLSLVAQRTANSAVAEKEDLFIEDLRGFLWSNQGVTRTWQDVADESGLCYATVMNFARGDTKRPQARTIIKLMQALGYRLALVPANTRTIAGEVHLENYRSVRKSA